MASSNARVRRMIQNFHLVWLDGNIDEVNNDDYRDYIPELRQVVNTVNTFTDVDECIDFITSIEHEKTFMLLSEEFSEIIVPVVQDISHVSSIYIFSKKKVSDDKWTEEWPKVKGIFGNIRSISEALKQAAQDCDYNSISISFIKPTDGVPNQNLDTQDQSFMYTQILKEILLTIDFEQVHFDEFLTYCQEQFVGNNSELKNVEKLRKEYHDHQPIWWYTYNCFLYSMLNRALRLMEIDLIIKMGFFIQDLHNHIANVHSDQYGTHNPSDSFTVYRGQGLSQTDFDQLKRTQGGLLSFNNFLSTSVDRAVSLGFAESNGNNPNLIGVLFEITINPSIFSSPFANVKNLSRYQQEEEILFAMHSVFRIVQIKQIDGNTRLWQVDLTLTSDNDPQLHALTKRIQEETFPTANGWYRLGILLVKLGQFDKAQQLFDIMLDQTTDEGNKANIYHILGYIKAAQGEYAEAIEFYEKSNKICQQIRSPNHSIMSLSYGNIGSVYYNTGDYLKALSYYEKDLEISEKTLPAYHSHFAIIYDNIGTVYDKTGEYSKALSYYEKSLEISQKNLPANHPSLAITYNNIGSGYDNMGEYSKALSYHEKALEIEQKTLPANHPSLASSYDNIGLVYHNMGEHSKALSYHEKALQIEQKTLPANHPHLVTSYNNIGSVYNSMGEYSKALSYYEKVFEIEQKTSSPNHPQLATSYNNIGLVYDNMDEYSKALPYYEKALEIRQKTLPADHRDFIISYNSIGSVHNDMGEYSKALLYYEKALEISRNTLPVNLLNLAISYNNIGLVYKNMREFWRALSYLEKALEIFEKTLPAHHPNVACSYNNIGLVYENIGDYKKALSFYEHTIDIGLRSLPANHPNLQKTRRCIERVKKNL